ncbi:MAG: NAD(P)-dependent oxidoreductase, partial [Planctomycetales bacterium]
MQKVTVTGAAGRLGRLVVERLVNDGREVFAVDKVRPDKPRCRFVTADMTDGTAAYDVLQGSDAVIHLAAVPGPRMKPESALFENNVLGTHNVVRAAAALGLKKVVFGSSAFALGWHEDAARCWPRYLPVDESHPLAPMEAYGLSKQVGEDVCASVSASSGVPIVSLRMMNIVHPEPVGQLPWPTPTKEHPVRFVMWPYVDARDAAAACVLALDAETMGHEAVFIGAADLRFDCLTEDLIRGLVPDDVEIRRPL